MNLGPLPLQEKVLLTADPSLQPLATFISLLKICLLYSMNALPVCVYVYMPYVYLVPMEVRRGPWIPLLGVAITGSCELPCECWDLNPGPLEEQQVLFTSEPQLQPP